MKKITEFYLETFLKKDVKALKIIGARPKCKPYICICDVEECSYFVKDTDIRKLYLAIKRHMKYK